jgi:dUTP pyrophosphatase
MSDVGVYTFKENIPLPAFGTDLASCFDLAYHNPFGHSIQGYDQESKPQTLRTISEMNAETENAFVFPPGYRLLVPTCMIFDLPEGHDMRVHPRSGVSFKQGLTLINCEGVIDEDYTQQLFIPMINLSTRSVIVKQGTRLAQSEICS